MDISGSRHKFGFTIVELLVVIVVIGILAAITIVSYTGISNRATISSMQSDLSNASTKLRLYQVENSVLPTTAADAITAKLISPSPLMDYYSYNVDNVSNPQYFCYMCRKGSDVYAVDSNSAPSKGVCLTNLVSNGDFSNGTTGWGSELQSSFQVENGRGVMYLNPAYNVLRLTRIYDFVINKKYYVKIDSLSNNATSGGYRFEIYDFTNGTKYGENISRLLINYSNVFTLSGTLSPTSRFSWLFEGIAPQLTTTNYGFDNIVLTDLTAVFGAGNEPTKAQMDTMMSQFPNGWFNTTMKVNL